MQGSVKEKFTFSYENEAAASYLVINHEGDEQIIDYQVEMISNNPNPSILPVVVRRKDNTVRLYYNITSKQSLSGILKRKIDRNEFIDIMINISKVILESKNYFLSDNSFLLDDEYIFLNPMTREVSLTYLPIRNNTDANENFKSFLIKLAVCWADVIYTSDNLIQKILSSTKNENFNISEFSKLLHDLKDRKTDSQKELQQEVSRSTSQKEVQKEEASSLNIESKNVDRTDIESPKSSSQGNILSTSRKELTFTNIPGNTYGKVDIPGVDSKSRVLPVKQKSSVCKDNHNAAGNKVSGVSRYTFLIGGIIVQLLILAVSGIIAVKTGGESSGGDKVTTYSAIFVAAAGVSFLMWKQVLDKMKTTLAGSVNKEAKGKSDVKNGNVINMDKFEYKKINIRPMQMEADNKTDFKGVPDSSNDTTCLADCQSECQRYDDTVLLGHSNDSFPVLKSVGNGGSDTVVIDKSSFIIGRMKEQVDFAVDNNTVGKVHAEIVSKDGLYFIKDLNSRNGTFINGERIENNREYQLQNNDRIAFSNAEFTFIIP